MLTVSGSGWLEDVAGWEGATGAAGAWFQASPELFDVVRQARGFAEETGGLFDPTMLGALEAAGYDKSMDDIRAHGVSAQPRSGYHTPGAFRAIQLDEANQAVHLPLNVRIDLGGIAKGWIAEQAAPEEQQSEADVEACPQREQTLEAQRGQAEVNGDEDAQDGARSP